MRPVTKNSKEKMTMNDFEKVAEILGEGFLADHIVRDKDFTNSQKFMKEIIIGREIVNGEKLVGNPLRCLRRYKWFLEWFMLKYGKTPCKSKKEAQQLLEQTIQAIGNPSEEDWKHFWNWFRRKTLNIVSSYIM